jgi:hypothetical protein
MPFFHVPLSIGLSLLHLYVWKRLVRDTMAPGPWRRVLAVVFVVGDACMVAALLLSTRVDPAIGQWFAWPGYLWFGIFFYLVLTTLVLELPRLALRPWVRRDPGDGGISRRQFLARGSAAVVGATAAVAVGVGVPTALGLPEIKRVRIGLPRLDPRAAGCRIALVSDIHLSALQGRGFTEDLVRLINAERPDLVAIAGDLVDGEVEHLTSAAEPLRNLRSTHGTFFVTGNHEYYYRYAEWLDFVPTLDIRVLLNERTTITHNGGEFELAGLIDPNATLEGAPGPDVAKTLSGWDGERALVMLAHQPASLEEVAARGVDLQLSGHTHGGQIAPFNLLVKALEGTTAGLSRMGDTQLYVTRGAGYWGPPLRVGAPPDISIIELTTR